MTIADICILLALIVALASVMPAKFDGKKEYDNAAPRDPEFYKSGVRARALWAQQNGFEALPFFAASVILAEMRMAPQGVVNGLAAAFIAVRIVYSVLYITDRPALRSGAWALGLACTLAIFFAPLWAGH